MRRACWLLLVAVLVGASASAQEELVARVFTLEHRDVGEAAQTVQAMLSEAGSMHVKPATRQLTVQDEAPVIRRVAGFLEDYDVPRPQGYRLLIRLIDAYETAPAAAAAEEELDVELREKLRRTFRLQHYRLRAASRVEGELGDEVQLDLGEGYRLEFVCTPFTLSRVRVPSSGARQSARRSEAGEADEGRRTGERRDPGRYLAAAERYRLRHLTLLRQVATDDDAVALEEVLRTGIALTPGQRVVLGAMSSEGARRALVLVIEMPATDGEEED